MSARFSPTFGSANESSLARERGVSPSDPARSDRQPSRSRQGAIPAIRNHPSRLCRLMALLLAIAATASAAAHGVKPSVLEQRTDITAKMIETAVRNGINFMPRFRKTEVSNADLAAIVSYLVHR